MTLHAKIFDSKRFKIKIYFLVFLFSIDIVMNSFVQFNSFGTYNTIKYYGLENVTVLPKTIGLILFVVQLLVQWMMLFVTLSIFLNTFQFQLGMVKNICNEFKYTFVMIGLYPTFFIMEKVIRLVYLEKK